MIRQLIVGTAVALQHLGDEMVAKGMKKANVIIGGSLHVFTHIYM
jgi:hypothetical protein